jgi:galactose oxidase-like protein/Big-like domain-containing protein
VAYPGSQVAGDLNVVIVGWNDTTAQISSITDSKGNAYHLAIGPTLLSGALSQSIYYASNIVAGGTNTVTVNFSTAAQYPDVRILEYSGISSSNPLDGTSGAAEITPLVSYDNSSGVVTTTNAVDLLVAANAVLGVTAGPGPNFNSRMITQDSDIAEDRVVQVSGFYSATAKAPASGGFVMQLVAFRAASNPSPDTTPPTVAISSPTGGTLTGTATVTVTASDTGTGVMAVQLQVDGIPYGTAANVSPYTFALNTTSFANGPHSLTATAWDYANNSASTSAVSVTFSNSSPGNPIQSGVMSGTTPLPIVAVNSVLLPTGKVLLYGGQSDGFDAFVWNPTLNTIESAPAPVNIFCTGTEQMANGQIMVVGGTPPSTEHTGIPAANIFNPATESWTVVPDMAYPRWYPTATTLSDGTIMVNSGETNCDECDETIPEIYSPLTNSWSQLSSAPWFFPYYPHVYLLPNGTVFAPADAEAPILSYQLNLSTLTWTQVGGAAVDGGSSVMYLPNKFLKVGTSVDPDLATRPSVATAYVLDMTQPSPSWTQISNMSFARTYMNTTLLPDGTVLVTGGGTTTYAVGLSDAVLPVELWTPATMTWTTLASMSAPRLYHSEGLLLPDGRVLISGGGSWNAAVESTNQDSAEFFSPPYLFKGARPVITSAPSQLSYAQVFNVQTPNAGQIASVSLIRFGSVTHAINMSQRFLPLSFSAGSGSLTVTAPVNSNLAPPGNYLLFIVDTNGVPSIASIVNL